MFANNQKVVKVITMPMCKTATVQTVAKVTQYKVTLDDSSLEYDPLTGREIEPAMAFAGIYSEIIPFDGGEAERWFNIRTEPKDSGMVEKIAKTKKTTKKTTKKLNRHGRAVKL